MIDPTARQRLYSRREALGLLGTAAAAGAAVSGVGLPPLRAQQRFTSVDPPEFAAGAVIRTLQGDVDPAALADGATLFHEHVGRADVDLAVEELQACAFDGARLHRRCGHRPAFAGAGGASERHRRAQRGCAS